MTETPRIPTQQDLYELSLTNQILAHAVAFHRAQLLTWEQALSLAVEELVRANAHINKLAVALSEIQMPAPLEIQFSELDEESKQRILARWGDPENFPPCR